MAEKLLIIFPTATTTTTTLVLLSLLLTLLSSFIPTARRTILMPVEAVTILLKQERSMEAKKTRVQEKHPNGHRLQSKLAVGNDFSILSNILSLFPEQELMLY
jgi:hypothetical protein